MKLDLMEENLVHTLEWIRWTSRQVRLGNIGFAALNRMCREARSYGLTEAEIEAARRSGAKTAAEKDPAEVSDPDVCSPP
jgi:hypothetical protein